MCAKLQVTEGCMEKTRLVFVVKVKSNVKNKGMYIFENGHLAKEAIACVEHDYNKLYSTKCVVKACELPLDLFEKVVVYNDIDTFEAKLKKDFALDKQDLTK